MPVRPARPVRTCVVGASVSSPGVDESLIHKQQTTYYGSLSNVRLEASSGGELCLREV